MHYFVLIRAMRLSDATEAAYKSLCHGKLHFIYFVGLAAQ